MSGLNVLIVGASIAGPTTAYWLAKAGAKVTVIERYPELRKGGQNIDIRTTGVTVMRKTPGMEEAVRSNLCGLEGVSVVRENGTPMAVLRATGNPDQQSLISEYEIFRGDLAKVLYDMTKDHPRIQYIFNEQVTASQQKPTGKDGSVTVEFMNGYPTTEYDLVVACDGSTSRTRAIGLECDVRANVHAVNAFSAYFSIPEDLLNGSKIGQGINTIPGRFYGIKPDPAGVSRINFTSVLPKADPDAMLPFREASKQGTDALKKYVFKRFENSLWRVPELLEGMLRSDDFYASEMLQVRLPSLFKGRFVLVGDAGYSPGPTGAGTSLAMTGGYILAGEICKHKGDLTAGLQGYEERMRPIIADMQKIPPGVLNFMAPQTAWGLWLRNTLFIVVAYLTSFGSMFSWVGGLFASSMGSDKYDIPDYDWVE